MPSCSKRMSTSSELSEPKRDNLQFPPTTSSHCCSTSKSEVMAKWTCSSAGSTSRHYCSRARRRPGTVMATSVVGFPSWSAMMMVILTTWCLVLNGSFRSFPPSLVMADGSATCRDLALHFPCSCSSNGPLVYIRCENGDMIEVIESLDKVMRSHLPEIHELRLVRNRIPKMPTRAFGSLRIQNLVLSNNGMEAIGRQAFAGLETSLVELVIEEPSLLSIPSETIAPLRELEVLVIKGTPVHELEPFVGPSRLRFVQVDGAALLDIPPQSFVALPSLRFLHITNSAVRKVHPRAFHDLPSLMMVNFTGNHISAIHPEAFSVTPSLETLILNSNDLREPEMVSEAVSSLRSLRTLELRNNAIRRLPVRAFDRLESVENLMLSDNDLSEIHPAAFSRMPSLQTLDLGFSGVQVLHPNTFDGTPRLAELYLPANNVTDVGAITAATRALPSLRVLDLSRNGATSVEPGVFRGHHNLESLYLDRNQLKEVRMDAFADLRNLRKLDLHDNYLTSDSMQGVGRPWRLPKLHTLVLSRNELSDVNNEIFNQMPAIAHLDLRDNNIQHLQEGFARLQKLEYLNVSYNKIEDIPLGAFTRLRDLRDLDLSYNSISGLGPGVLADLRNLRALHLKHNQISSFASDSLPEDSNLVFLDVSENFIKDFADWPSSARKRLRHLDLCWNEITHIHEDYFKGMDSLNTLLLANNMVKSIDPVALKPMASLRHLDLSGNRLRRLDSDLPSFMDSVEYFNISRNNLESLPSFHSLSRLQTFDACNNSLTRLEPGIFSGANSLQLVDLSDNQLADVPRGMFDSLGALRRVNLKRNRLPQVPSGFATNLWSLASVDLADNDIEVINEGAFNSLPNLREINLSHNRIRRFSPGSFSSLGSLRMLRMDGNALENLERGVFQAVPEIKYVNLSHNLFQNFPRDGLMDVGSVKVLDLSYNRIQEVFQDDLEDLGDVSSVMLNDNNICRFHGSRNYRSSRNSTLRMKSLDLHNNYLMRLPEESFRDLMDSVNNLDVSGNPLMCDCDMAWLRDEYGRTIEEDFESQRRSGRGWDTTSPPAPHLRSASSSPPELEPKCYFPPEMRGHALRDMPMSAFICNRIDDLANVDGCSLLPDVEKEAILSSSEPTGQFTGPISTFLGTSVVPSDLPATLAEVGFTGFKPTETATPSTSSIPTTPSYLGVATGTAASGIAALAPIPPSAASVTAPGVNTTDELPMPFQTFHRLAHESDQVSVLADQAPFGWVPPPQMTTNNPSAEEIRRKDQVDRPNGERILAGQHSSDFIPGDTPTVYAGSAIKNGVTQAIDEGTKKRKSFFGLPIPKLPKFQLPRLPVDLRLTFGKKKHRSEAGPILTDTEEPIWFGSHETANLPTPTPADITDPGLELSSTGSADGPTSTGPHENHHPSFRPSLLSGFHADDNGLVTRPRFNSRPSPPTFTPPPATYEQDSILSTLNGQHITDSHERPSSPGNFPSSEGTTAKGDHPQNGAEDHEATLPKSDKTRLRLPKDYFGGGISSVGENNIKNTSSTDETLLETDKTDSNGWKGLLKPTAEGTSSSGTGKGLLPNSKPIKTLTKPTGAVTRFIDNSEHHKTLDEVNFPFDDVNNPHEVDVYHKGTPKTPTGQSRDSEVDPTSAGTSTGRSFDSSKKNQPESTNDASSALSNFLSLFTSSQTPETEVEESTEKLSSAPTAPMNQSSTGTGSGKVDDFLFGLTKRRRKSEKVSKPLPHQHEPTGPEDEFSWAGMFGLRPPSANELPPEEETSTPVAFTDRNDELATKEPEGSQTVSNRAYDELEFMNKFVNNFRDEVYTDVTGRAATSGATSSGQSPLLSVFYCLWCSVLCFPWFILTVVRFGAVWR